MTLQIDDLDEHRYFLSVILSFLTETEGVSFLICRKKWTRRFLPIFRLPKENKNTNEKTKNRHRFVVFPVQDSAVRLDRLNTRRWNLRRKELKKQHIEVQEMVIGMGTANKSISEMANDEWNQLLILASSQAQGTNDTPADTSQETAASTSFQHPPLLKILTHSKTITTTNPISSPSTPSFFLPGTNLLVSYPRSGNTLLRTYLESWTGIVTGSDTRPDRTLSLALADQFDLCGEGLVVPSQVFCKTHWPERTGYKPYRAHRAILVVRNPYDAIDSCWNLNLTNTHTDKVIDQVYQEHQDFYYDYVRNEMKVWCQFHNFWMNHQYLDHTSNKRSSGGNPPQKIPILVIRYEDLIQHPQQELTKILEFCAYPGIATSPIMQQRLKIMLNSKKSRHGYHKKSASTFASASSISSELKMTVLAASGPGYNTGETVNPAVTNTDSTSVTTDSTTETTASSASQSTNISRNGRSLKRFSPQLVEELHKIDSQYSLPKNQASLLQRFGYNVYHQQFPNNFCRKGMSPPLTLLMEPDTPSLSSPSISPPPFVLVNPSKNSNDYLIRPLDCPFGRNMRNWRREKTVDDTQPFPTTKSVAVKSAENTSVSKEQQSNEEKE